VLLVVLCHRGVLHEGVVAVGPSAMEVPVDLVAGTVRETAVDVAVVEFEAVEDLDVVVEVLAVHDEDVLLVGDVEAAVLVAVEVGGAQVGAQAVGALGVLLEDVEALQAVVLQLQRFKIVIGGGGGSEGTHGGALGAGSGVARVLLLDLLAAGGRGRGFGQLETGEDRLGGVQEALASQWRLSKWSHVD
jgi:hypothetical protein